MFPQLVICEALITVSSPEVKSEMAKKSIKTFFKHFPLPPKHLHQKISLGLMGAEWKVRGVQNRRQRNCKQRVYSQFNQIYIFYHLDLKKVSLVFSVIFLQNSMDRRKKS
jgi:hypothetical protein